MKKTALEILQELAKSTIRDPAALAAFIGRKKEGKDTFQKQAAAGKYHKKKTDKLGGGKRFAKLEHTLANKSMMDDVSERTIRAKYDGRCKLCSKPYKAGQTISYFPKAAATACYGGCQPRAPKPGTPKEGSEG